MVFRGEVLSTVRIGYPPYREFLSVLALVDYDNVPVLHRNRGVEHVIGRILDTVGPGAFTSGEHVRIRLYGGWLEESSLSRSAQVLTAELSQSFPKAVNIVHGQAQTTVIVAPELATSLLINPRRILENTYRPKGMPQGLRCEQPPYAGCIDSHSCPLFPMHAFISSTGCPTQGCGVELTDIVKRAEQKLVDGMLITDLVYLAHTGEFSVMVVSSDEDIWPGILSAITLGTRVYHLHPKPGRTTPARYSSGVGPNYVELTSNWPRP